MKKTSKIILSIAFAFIMFVPMLFLSGCTFTNNSTPTVNFTEGNWCVSERVSTTAEKTTYSKTPNTYGYMYLVFNANYSGSIYSYNLAQSEFSNAGDFTWGYKNDSTTKLNILNIGGLSGNDGEIETISNTSLKFIYPDGSYYILTKNYYNL